MANNRIAVYMKDPLKEFCEKESTKIFGESNVSGYLTLLVQEEKRKQEEETEQKEND